jgi:hypothetical protein
MDLSDLEALFAQRGSDAGPVEGGSLDSGQHTALGSVHDPSDGSGVAGLAGRKGRRGDDGAASRMDQTVSVSAGVGVDANDVFKQLSNDGHGTLDRLSGHGRLGPVVVAQRHICKESRPGHGAPEWTGF